MHVLLCYDGGRYKGGVFCHEKENPCNGQLYRYANVCGTETDGKTVNYATGKENDRSKVTYEPNGWTGPDRTFVGTQAGWQNNYRIVRRDELVDFTGCTELKFDLFINYLKI